MFKKFFDYYGFSKIEQRGFYILLSLILSIVLFQMVFEYFDRSELVNHQIVELDDAPALNDEQAERTDERGTPAYTQHFEKRKEIKYFTFDPNGLPIEKWQELGFSAKQAAAIKNYEAKGGKFRRKEDVAKMYVVSAEDYARLEPYIVIAEQKESKELTTVGREPVVYKEKENFIVDINTADTSALKRLRGIGSVLASRTVKYRDALGGFHHVSQMGEVYGLSPEVFEALKPQLTISNANLKKINLNSLSEAGMSKHPYISRKQAQLISNYRKQHGRVNFEDLKNIHAFDEEFLRKIEPYLEW